MHQPPQAQTPRPRWSVSLNLPYPTPLNLSAGDRIVVVVQKQRSTIPESGGSASSAAASAASKVRRGDVRHAVVVRAAKELRRADGSSVRFDDNACVLVSKAGEPIGSRVTGAVAAELRYKGWARILALAPAHV
jgi:ribosomal protein L14